MKARRVLSFVFVLAAIMAIVVSVQASAPGFVGGWESTDVYDLSYQQMSIGGGRSQYHIYFIDHSASACGGNPANLQGFAALNADNQLTGTFAVYCFTPHLFLGNFPFMIIYDPVTDTLVDQSGVVWHRTGFK